jgi:hypothetical protein
LAPGIPQGLRVVGATVLAMIVVAGIWLGIGLVWGQLNPPGIQAGNSDVHWPLYLRGIGGGIGWNWMLRRQRAILPRQIQQIDFPGTGLGLGTMVALLISLLLGGWLHP